MKNAIILFMLLGLCGCERGCQQIEKDWQTGKRQYEVIMWSGGDTVFHDRFRGIINNSEHSDGIYYSKGDTLIEVSGDYVVKSVK